MSYEDQLIREATGQTRDFEESCEETLEAQGEIVSNETGNAQQGEPMWDGRISTY